ncbi:MAG: VOC family protein [Steroidobacteraceae bacterium]
MTKTIRLIAAAGAAFLVAGAAQAGASLFAGRVGAVNVAQVAKFYESAFGLKEVNRLKFPGNMEIMMNFGDTVAAAKANRSPQVVVMHRATNDIADTVPHLIFTVTDIRATAAAIQAAGGKVLSKPRAFGKGGMHVGIAADPAGNRLELIQLPKR